MTFKFLHLHHHFSLGETVASALQGATDSEKRVLCLSAENESLKQNLSLTQGLLQQLSTIPSQSSTMLIKVRHTWRPGVATRQAASSRHIMSGGEATCDLLPQENENLRSRVQQLELSLQQRAEQLSHLERQSEQSEWRRGEEVRKREERVRELQLELDRERGKEPVVKAGLLSNTYIIFIFFAQYIAVIVQIPELKICCLYYCCLSCSFVSYFWASLLESTHFGCYFFLSNTACLSWLFLSSQCIVSVLRCKSIQNLSRLFLSMSPRPWRWNHLPH